VPRCPEYAVPGAPYCLTHSRQRWALGLTGQRKTGRRWERLRKATLRRQHGRCPCGAWATDVHHIDDNPANDTLANLIALCWECHLARHGAAPRRRQSVR
jgi:5-methylcytosine-specific restriction endonuclease McrA